MLGIWENSPHSYNVESIIQNFPVITLCKFKWNSRESFRPVWKVWMVNVVRYASETKTDNLFTTTVHYQGGTLMETFQSLSNQLPRLTLKLLSKNVNLELNGISFVRALLLSYLMLLIDWDRKYSAKHSMVLAEKSSSIVPLPVSRTLLYKPLSRHSKFNALTFQFLYVFQTFICKNI